MVLLTLARTVARDLQFTALVMKTILRDNKNQETLAFNVLQKYL